MRSDVGVMGADAQPCNGWALRVLIDSQHIDQLIKDETQTVFADNTYMNKSRKAQPEKEGIFARRVRSRGELTVEQKSTTVYAPRFVRLWNICWIKLTVR